MHVLFVCVFVCECLFWKRVCTVCIQKASLQSAVTQFPPPLEGAPRLITAHISLRVCTGARLALTHTDGRACIRPCLEMCAHRVPAHTRAGCLAGHFGFSALSPVFAE